MVKIAFILHHPRIYFARDTRNLPRKRARAGFRPQKFEQIAVRTHGAPAGKFVKRQSFEWRLPVALPKPEFTKLLEKPRAFLSLILVLVAVVLLARWRTRRLARTSEGEPDFDENAEPVIFSLDLHRDGITPLDLRQ